ncbi:MAG: zf-HC2 domain-containing protein [Gammaproteobacteria bacterium]
MSKMLSCKEVSELVSQSLDRQLSLRERLGVRLHLVVCSMCRRYRKQITFISQATRQLLGRHSPTTALKPGARERIEEAIKKQVQEKR